MSNFYYHLFNLSRTRVILLFFAMTIGTSTICLTVVKPKPLSTKTQERTWEFVKEDYPKEVIEVIQVKNLNSENFLEEMTVEIKNVGDKPIYYLYFAGLLPESKNAVGTRMGVTLRYGDRRLTNKTELPRSQDTPIKPGESVHIKIDEQIAFGYKSAVREGKLSATEFSKMFSKVRFRFQVLSFGDGTGYTLGNYVDRNVKKQVSKETSLKTPFSSSFVAAGKKKMVGRNFICAEYDIAYDACCGINGCPVDVADYVREGNWNFPCNNGTWCNADDCGGPVFCNFWNLTSCGVEC